MLLLPPTRSLGIRRNSDPCFKNIVPFFLIKNCCNNKTTSNKFQYLKSPAVCCGFIPMPSFVIIALVAAGTLNLNKKFIHLFLSYHV